MAALTFETVEIKNHDELNFILGQSHFIKTVEDLYEVLVQHGGPGLKFGLAFCEASGDRLLRTDGNHPGLEELARDNALAIGAGHSFIVFLEAGFPVMVLNAIKGVPEVCRIYCATANPTSVVIAKTSDDKRGIMGVLDGQSPVGVEDETKKQERRDFLRMIGYKR